LAIARVRGDSAGDLAIAATEPISCRRVTTYSEESRGREWIRDVVKYGQFQGRIEDRRLIAGGGRYVADLVLPGMVHAVLLRSPHAHAAIRTVDASAARSAPGVLAVLTATELAADGVPDLPCDVNLVRPDGSKAFPARRPLLARDRVRFVGEGVALIIAETAAQAHDAAEAIDIDYEALPAVADMTAAKAAEALVWSEVADNAAFYWTKGDFGAAENAMKQAAQVASLASHVTRVNANSLEPRGAMGMIDEEGRYVLYASHQHPHQMKNALAPMLNVPPASVRVVAGDVGGSFGMKSGIYPEDVLVLWAAKRLGRPVRWIADRREGFLTDDHGRDVRFDASLSFDKDGRMLALQVHFEVNIGCYLSGRSLSLLNNIGGIAGVYRIPIIAADVVGLFTNSQTTAAYRGAGRPEATYTIERLIDLAAADMGIDPIELRRRNLVPASAIPYDTGFVFTYDSGDFAATMNRAVEIGDVAGFAARKKEAERRGKLLGLGVANPIEPAGGPYTKPGKDNTWLKVGSDGTVTFRAGTMSTGQGHETTFSQMISDQLGVPVSQIRYRFGDTDDLPAGRGNGGSSGLCVGGAALLGVTQKVIETGRASAAELLQSSPEQVSFAKGRFLIEGTGRSVGLSEVATHVELSKDGGLAESAEFQPPAVTFPNGSHVCEVEIDPDTGTLKITRYTVVEDIGTVINPTLVEGQMHGGIAQGLGQVLGERMVYDETGQLLTASFMDYQMPRADHMPRITIETRSVPTAVNPVGAKGVGEAGTVGAMAAAMNAICNALADRGVKHLEMPATPDRVWQALEDAKRSNAKARASLR